MIDTERTFRRQPGRWCLFVLAALLLRLAAPAAAQDLGDQVRQMVADADLGNARVGVLIRDLETGQDLVSLDAEQAMIPASNMKLVTSAAALMTLGRDFRFTTTIDRVGDDLIVRGEGDPALGDPVIEAERLARRAVAGQPHVRAPTADDVLDPWIHMLAQALAKRPARTLIIDDRIFDHTERVHPDWPENQLHKWYSAQVAGINFNTNCLDLYAAPGEAGGRPTVMTIPTDPPLQIDNRAVTGKRNAFWAARRPGSNLIILRGQIRFTLRTPIHVTLDDPPMFFGQLLQRRLRRLGIDIPAVERIAPKADPAAGENVVEHRTPLTTILVRCNRDSQNLYAEALIKRLGHHVTSQPGTWTNGAAAVRLFLSQALGPDAADAVIADGSGYSRSNRLSPQLIVKLLDHMHRQGSTGQLYRLSLATPGTGTLEKRFQSLRVVEEDASGRERTTPHKLRGELRAKSGYLNGVYALSGYVTYPQRTIAFSILANDYTRPGANIKQLHEDVIVAIDRAVAAMP